MQRFILAVLGTLIFLQTAQASKARLDSLANSFHLVDSQTIFDRPIDLIYLEKSINLESGLTNATTARDNAEAILTYSDQAGRHYGFAMGHQEPSVYYSRKLINTISGQSFQVTQNPLHFFYAIDNSVTSYAFGIFHSAKTDKSQGLSESTTGASFGAEIGLFHINALLIPINSDQQTGGKKFDGGGHMQMSFTYLSEQTLFEFKYKISNAKLLTDSGAVKTENESHSIDEVAIGVADNNSQNGNNFFWGAQFLSTRINCKLKASTECGKNFSRTTVPVWFGIEAEASKWLTIRGAVKQSFLFNFSKDEVGYSSLIIDGATGSVSEFGSGPNDTTVTAGFGFKLNNIEIDGSLATATSQQMNSSNFLTQASLTYKF